jgi:hypothetical protein
MRTLTRWLAGFLERDHAENLLGDLQERGHFGSWRGLTDVARMLAGEQLPLWRRWRTWGLALLLLAPSSLLLAPAISIGMTVRQMSWTEGPMRGLTFALGMTMLLSFGVGYSAARLSGRAFPSMFFAVLVIALQPWRWVELLSVLEILTAVLVSHVLPLLLGVWAGHSIWRPGAGVVYALCVGGVFALGISLVGMTIDFFLGLPLFWPIFAPARQFMSRQRS